MAFTLSMKPKCTYETPWLSIAVPNGWMIGRKREWIHLRAPEHPEAEIKIQPTAKATDDASCDDMNMPFWEQYSPVIREVTVGQFAGRILRLDRGDGPESRFAFWSGPFLLHGAITGCKDLDELEADVLRIIEQTETKPDNKSIHLTLLSSRK